MAAQQDGLRTRSRLDQLDTGGDRGGRGHRNLLRLAQAGQRFVPGRQRPARQGGLVRPGPGRWVPDGRPEHLRQACEGSLRRLRLDRIDLSR